MTTIQLEQILSKQRGKALEFTLEELCDLVKPKSREELVLALGDLVRTGKIKQVIRVVSPKTQGGIGDYETLDDVPSVANDWRTDTQIEVTPDDLRVIYILPG